MPANLFYRLKHNLHWACFFLRQVANNSSAEQPCSGRLGRGCHSMWRWGLGRKRRGKRMRVQGFWREIKTNYSPSDGEFDCSCQERLCLLSVLNPPSHPYPTPRSVPAMGTGHLQRLPGVEVQRFLPSRGKDSSPCERWYEIGEGRQASCAEAPGVGLSTSQSKTLPTLPHLGSDYSISFRPLPLYFSPFSSWPFGILLLISTSATNGLGCGRKQTLKVEHPCLSVKQEGMQENRQQGSWN